MNASDTLEPDGVAALDAVRGGFSLRDNLKRWTHRKPARQSPFTVCADAAGLSLTADGESRAMSWAEMESIRIEVNDRQPFGVALWWAVEGPTKRMFFPKESDGADTVAEAFRAAFADFDSEAVARAEEARAEARFICWQRGTGPR